MGKSILRGTDFFPGASNDGCFTWSRLAGNEAWTHLQVLSRQQRTQVFKARSGNYGSWYLLPPHPLHGVDAGTDSSQAEGNR